MNHSKSNSSPLRVAIIRSSSIGDVVLATAAIQYAQAWTKLGNRSVELHWIGRTPALDLIHLHCPGVVCHDIDAITKLEAGGLNSTHEGRFPATIDACIDLQGNLRSRNLTRRIRQRHGGIVVRSSKRYLARSLLVLCSRLLGRSKVSLTIQSSLIRHYPPIPQFRLAAMAMAQALGENSEALNQATPKLDTPIFDQRLDPEIPWLAIAPGASHPAKKAPVQVFEQVMGALAGKIPADSRIGIVLLGDPRERIDCDELERRLTANQWDGPVLNLAGSTKLHDTVAILAGCRAILSNDSSLAHIAEALGKPSFMLFGPTTEAFGFAPHLMASRAFSAPLGCRPCSKHGKGQCRYGDHACFRGINARDAANALAGVFL